MSDTPEITVVYPTHRQDPAFEWFADGLARQLDPGDAGRVEVVVVDGADGADAPGRAEEFRAAAAGRFALVHSPPKPTVFSGAHRRTRVDMHAASNARNTGIVLARGHYVVVADDCSVPMPGWWDEVREASRHHYVVAGAYEKRRDMVVVDGELVASSPYPGGADIRWADGDDDLVTRIPGAHLFGSSVGAPRDLLLDVDGYDEICDGMGGEDYHIGVRLELAGIPLFYSRRMLTVESDELHHGNGQQYHRADPEIDADLYTRRLADFGVTRRSTDGRCDASHMVLDILYGLRQRASIGNHTRLVDTPADDLPSTAANLPGTYWLDGRAWEDL